jgi:hypothetical protein
MAAQSKNDGRFLSLCEATDLENRGCLGLLSSFHTPCALLRRSLSAPRPAVPQTLRTRQFDPLLPFKIGPVNEQEAPESGPWLKA